MLRPSLLLLTPRFPAPLVGGDRLRIGRIAQALAEHVDIDLLSLAETPEERAEPAPDWARRVERLPLDGRAARARVLAAAANGGVMQTAYYADAGMRRRVAARSGDYDGVLAHLLRAGAWLDGIAHPARMVEMTDAIALNYDRVRRVQGRFASPRAFLYSLEQPRLARAERAALSRFDLLSFVSPVDAEWLYGTPLPDRVVVAPQGVDTDAFPLLGPGPERRIVFVGHMGTEQNFDAAWWFGREVMPALGGDGWRFDVIGRIPDAARARLSSLPYVRVTGEVASIPDACRGAAMAVCPMRIGAGVQNKVLEYLAMGLPTIITPLGQEGIGGRHGHELLVADGAGDTVAAVRAITALPDRGRGMGEAGRAFVGRAFGWQAALAPLVTAVLATIDRGRQDRRRSRG